MSQITDELMSPLLLLGTVINVGFQSLQVQTFSLFQNLMDRGFTPQAWMSHIAPHVGGTALPPKGKNVNNFYILMSNSWGHLDTVIAEALEYRMR